jgi:hypothetical protein
MNLGLLGGLVLQERCVASKVYHLAGVLEALWRNKFDRYIGDLRRWSVQGVLVAEVVIGPTVFELTES